MNTRCFTNIDIIYDELGVLEKCTYIYSYTAMSSAGFQGTVRSRQVHQLKQGAHVGCGLPMLFNITDLTNSIAEPYFKATRWVICELLKFNTANWLAFPFKYKAFDKYNTSTTKKDSELPCLCQQD